MKKNFLTLVFVAFLSMVFGVSIAQNIEVSGEQSGIWQADTVFVTGDVNVQDVLQIEAGTTVLFKGYYSICVEKGASVQAIGTEDEPIVFTVSDTTGFHIFDSGRGGWNGIRMDKAGKSDFDYCVFQYGKASSKVQQRGGAFSIRNCEEVNFSNSNMFCNFSREYGGAVYGENSSIRMDGCNVDENKVYTGLDTVYFMYGGGMCFLKCDLELRNMRFRRNYGAITIGGALSMDSCSVVLDRAEFRDNYGLNGAGLYIMRCNDKECRISNCLFDHNHAGHFAGGLAFANASPEVDNITVTRNRADGVNCQGIFFFENSAPKMNNCIVWGNKNMESLNFSDSTQMWLWTFENYAPEFRNCLIQGGLKFVTGAENIVVNENMMEDNPCFVDLENGDLHVMPNSPCINAGTQVIAQEIIDGFDLDGVWRVCGNGIDLGPYEFTASDVAEHELASRSVVVLGNPITDSSKAQVELGKAGQVTASVYSVDGKMVWNNDFGVLNTGINDLDLSELMQLNSGIYFLQINSADGVAAVKIVR